MVDPYGDIRTRVVPQPAPPPFQPIRAPEGPIYCGCTECRIARGEMTAPPLVPALNTAATQHMDDVFAELDTKSRGELLDLIRDMREDWATLNEIHNRRAQRSAWCSEYEERQGIHNRNLKTLKLLGRLVNTKADEMEGRGL